MWETVHAGSTWRGELRDRAKSGADVCFEFIVIPRFNDDGEIERFITISTDITAIRQQAQTLQATIDNFPGGLALIDRELRLVACNRLYRTLLELPDSFFIGEPPKLETLVRYRAERGDYGPGSVEQVVKARLDTLLSPVPITTERNETSGRVLEIRCVPVEGGAHLNTYVDVTDQRRAEAELTRANATLQAFIKHAPAAVAMFDTDMRYVAHTDRWLQDYNLPENSLVGRSHYDVFPDAPEHWKAKHQRILAGAIESRTGGSLPAGRRIDEYHPLGGASLAPGGQQHRRHDDADRGDLRAQTTRAAAVEARQAGQPDRIAEPPAVQRALGGDAGRRPATAASSPSD